VWRDSIGSSGSGAEGGAWADRAGATFRFGAESKSGGASLDAMSALVDWAADRADGMF
jgi:hypothetical protein